MNTCQKLKSSAKLFYEEHVLGTASVRTRAGDFFRNCGVVDLAINAIAATGQQNQTIR